MAVGRESKLGRKTEETRKAYKLLVTKGFPVPEPIPNERNELPFVLRWLKTFTASGIDLNRTNYQGLTILHVLLSDFASFSLPYMVDYLCQNGADINLKDYHYKRNALMWLFCNKGWLEFSCENISYRIEEATAIKLVQYGANITDQDAEQNNVLWYMINPHDRCIRGLHVTMIEKALEKGLDVSAPVCHGIDGYHPLQLLFWGVAKRERRGYGKSLTSKLVELYSRYGLDLNNSVDCNGNNLLLYVLCNHDIIPKAFDIIHELIIKGTNLNKKNTDGCNAFLILGTRIRFCGRKTLDLISLLIEYGIDVNAERDGKTALTELCYYPHTSQKINLRMIRHILNHGIAMTTPAIEYLHLLLDLVLRRGLFHLAYPNRSFLSKQAADDFYTILKRLISSANITSPKEKEMLNHALFRICACYDDENILQVIRLLCDHGADVNAVCDGSVRSELEAKQVYTRPGLNCMEFIAYNRRKKCTEEDAYQVFIQYGFNFRKKTC